VVTGTIGQQLVKARRCARGSREAKPWRRRRRRSPSSGGLKKMWPLISPARRACSSFMRCLMMLCPVFQRMGAAALSGDVIEERSAEHFTSLSDRSAGPDARSRHATRGSSGLIAPEDLAAVLSTTPMRSASPSYAMPQSSALGRCTRLTRSSTSFPRAGRIRVMHGKATVHVDVARRPTSTPSVRSSWRVAMRTTSAAAAVDRRSGVRSSRQADVAAATKLDVGVVDRRLADEAPPARDEVLRSIIAAQILRPVWPLQRGSCRASS
jgi:hypothetical protein